MATLKIVPKKDWEIVKEYLYADNGGAVVLAPESRLDDFPEDQAGILRNSDGESLNYDFGGEPEIYIEVLEYPDTYCAEEILSELKNRQKEL